MQFLPLSMDPQINKGQILLDLLNIDLAMLWMEKIWIPFCLFLQLEFAYLLVWEFSRNYESNIYQMHELGKSFYHTEPQAHIILVSIYF